MDQVISMSLNPSESPLDRLTDSAATPDDRTYVTILHLTALSFIVLGPLSFLPALVMWVVRKDASPFVDDHGKECVNFQLSFLIWLFLAGLGTLWCVGLLFLLALPVVMAVAIIVNAVRAHHGEYVRYPMTIRFIS